MWDVSGDNGMGVSEGPAAEDEDRDGECPEDEDDDDEYLGDCDDQ